MASSWCQGESISQASALLAEPAQLAARTIGFRSPPLDCRSPALACPFTPIALPIHTDCVAHSHHIAIIIAATVQVYRARATNA